MANPNLEADVREQTKFLVDTTESLDQIKKELASIQSRLLWLRALVFFMTSIVVIVVGITVFRNELGKSVEPPPIPDDNILFNYVSLVLLFSGPFLLTFVVLYFLWHLPVWRNRSNPLDAQRLRIGQRITDQLGPSSPSGIWAFVSGMGAALEAFPSPGRFNRWRIPDDIPENEWAMVFRELCASPNDDKSADGDGK